MHEVHLNMARQTRKGFWNPTPLLNKRSQQKELTVAPYRNSCPNRRSQDVYPRATRYVTGLGTPAWIPGTSSEADHSWGSSVEGGGSLWWLCCVIGQSKVLLQHHQRAAELWGFRRRGSASAHATSDLGCFLAQCTKKKWAVEKLLAVIQK